MPVKKNAIRLPVAGMALAIVLAIALQSTPVSAKPAPKTEDLIVISQDAGYTIQDLEDMAKVIYSQAGAQWIPDEIQQYVGMVVLNRVAHEKFPDTIHDVIYQKGQYGAQKGMLDSAPDERSYRNAQWVLEHGSTLPANVVYQDNTPHGDGIYYVYEDPVIGPTYFCYIN